MAQGEWTCNQDGCDNPGAFRFTWPGRDEAAICASHHPKLVAVSRAIGLHLQLIPLDLDRRPPESEGESDHGE